MNRSYEDISYFLEECGPIVPRGGELPQEVDVAIIGAGYTGLWTAYYLLQSEPDLTVAILEAQVAGFGASGRNGGWCNATMAGLTPTAMAQRWGKQAAAKVILELRQTIVEVDRVMQQEDIKANATRGGVLRLARGDHEVPSVHRKYAELEELGLLDGHLLLNAEQARDLINVDGIRGAILDPHVMWVQPAKLARGLADTVERKGGAIYEETRVLGWKREGNRQVVSTTRGLLSAHNLVVATEAYSVGFREFRRSLLPLYSLAVLTEPLDETQWERIGWNGPFTASSQRLSVDYVSKTPDGRILFGGRGAPYHFGSRIRDVYDLDRATHEMLRNELRSWFPQLTGLRFTHAWGGPLGVPRDWVPNINFNPVSRLGHAFGYSGQGVAMSNLAGRMLTEQILDRSGWTNGSALAIIGHTSRPWEPEPLRWLGARYVQWSLARLDQSSAKSGRAPTGNTLGERLSRH